MRGKFLVCRLAVYARHPPVRWRGMCVCLEWWRGSEGELNLCLRERERERERKRGGRKQNRERESE